MSDRLTERTWRDMPGTDEFNKRMNFALWKRGKLDLLDHIEDPDEKAAAKKLASKRALMSSVWGSGVFNTHPDAALCKGKGSRVFESKVTATCDDEMAEVKKAARQWATDAFGHDFTTISDAIVPRRHSREIVKVPRREAAGFRGTPNHGGRSAAGWTSVAERLALRERCLAAAKKIGVKMTDICRPAGCTETNFLSPNSLKRADSANWLKLAAYLLRIESGEVKTLPRRLSTQGSYRIPNPTTLEERQALRERGVKLAKKMGLSFTAMMTLAGYPKAKIKWALKHGVRKDSNYWHPFRAWLDAKEKEVAHHG